MTDNPDDSCPLCGTERTRGDYCDRCDDERRQNGVYCASCGEYLLFNSEDLVNTTCQKCGGEAK